MVFSEGRCPLSNVIYVVLGKNTWSEDGAAAKKRERTKRRTLRRREMKKTRRRARNYIFVGVDGGFEV